MVVFILIASVLAFSNFTGYIGSDDISYISSAYFFKFKEPVVLQNAIASTRLGLILPQHLVYSIFGLSQASSVIFPFACYLFNILLTYLLAWEVFSDRKIALLSAFLWSIMPLSVFLSTIVLPDIPLLTFILLSVFFCIRGVKGERKKYIVLSGLSIGFAQTAKVTALIFVPALVLFIILNRKNKPKDVYFFVLGLASVLLFEFIFWYIQCGDGLFRLNVVRSMITRWKTQVNYVRGFRSVADNIWKIAFWIKKSIALGSPLGASIYALPSAIWILRARKKIPHSSILFYWFILFAVYLTYMAYTFPSYQPRYFLLLIFPLTIFLAYFLSRLSEKLPVIASIIFLTVVTLNIFQLKSHNFNYTQDTLHASRAAYKILNNSKRNFYVDPRNFQIFQLLSGFKIDNRWHYYPQDIKVSSSDYFNRSDDLENIATGDYVLIDWRMISFFKGFFSTPNKIFNPPLNWEPRYFFIDPRNKWLNLVLSKADRKLEVKKDASITDFTVNPIPADDKVSGLQFSKGNSQEPLSVFFDLNKKNNPGIILLKLDFSTGVDFEIHLYRFINGKRFYTAKIASLPQGYSGSTHFWLRTNDSSGIGFRLYAKRGRGSLTVSDLSLWSLADPPIKLARHE